MNCRIDFSIEMDTADYVMDVRWTEDGVDVAALVLRVSESEVLASRINRYSMFLIKGTQTIRDGTARGEKMYASFRLVFTKAVDRDIDILTLPR
jgi:hypothetical protein